MKKVVCFVILVLLLLGLGTAQAQIVDEKKWSFGGVFGWYSPSYGEINDWLEEINKYWKTDLGLGGGPIVGLTASYALTPNLSLRGEIARFRSETSDKATLSGSEWWYWYYNWEETLKFDGEMTVIPVIFTLVYTFPEIFPQEFDALQQKFSLRPYLGVGVGQFVTTAKGSAKYTYDEWLNGWHLYHDEWQIKDEDTDKPFGVQLLGGVEGELSERVSWSAELRYVSAEAELRSKKGLWGFETEADLGGLMFAGSLKIKV